MPSDVDAIRRWLTDIQHHIKLAQGFVAGMSYEAFKDDNLRLYAVTRCLEIISEASRRLPEELKDRHPSIQWRDMAAAGNIYRHEYEDVAAARVGKRSPSACRSCSPSSRVRCQHLGNKTHGLRSRSNFQMNWRKGSKRSHRRRGCPSDATASAFF
jgi:uncharacterized protein with HEPN domain